MRWGVDIVLRQLMYCSMLLSCLLTSARLDHNYVAATLSSLSTSLSEFSLLPRPYASLLDKIATKVSAYVTRVFDEINGWRWALKTAFAMAQFLREHRPPVQTDEEFVWVAMEKTFLRCQRAVMAEGGGGAASVSEAIILVEMVTIEIEANAAVSFCAPFLSKPTLLPPGPWDM